MSLDAFKMLALYAFFIAGLIMVLALDNAVAS
jgi:hypothetical protein